MLSSQRRYPSKFRGIWLGFLKVRDEEVPKLVRLYLAIELYRERKVSLGKASEIAGVSKWEIMEILASKNIPIQYDVKI